MKVQPNLSLNLSFADRKVKIIASCVLLLLSGFLFLKCSKMNEVSLNSRNFEDEIQLAQNLVFTFDKDLVGERDLENWEAVEYVKFEPEVSGKFKWTAKNELIFSPSESFRFATDYKATLTNEITKKSEKKYSLNAEKIEFHTPYLKPEKIESYWAKGRDGKLAPKVKVGFNYPVVKNETEGLLKVNVEDKPTEFSLGNTSDDNAIEMTLSGVKESKDDEPLKTVIEKGIKVKGSGSQSKETAELEGVLPTPFVVRITDVQTGFDGNEGFVRISTTQQLASDKVASGFSIEPKVETKTELTSNGFIIRGNFSDNETYLLKISDLRGVAGAKLDGEFTKDLFFGDMPAQIEFSNKKGNYLSSKGARNVGVRITNVPKVQVKISKIYENNLLAFLRNNRYENYEYYDEESKPNGFNYSDDYNGIYSDILVDKTIETGNLPKLRGSSLLNLPLPDQKNLRGVYMVALNSKDEYYLNASKLISVSDIGLMAKFSNDGNEMLVFANSILTTEPLSGVEINLISSNNQTVYTIETDGKGVAKFEKIKEKAPNFKVAMITAKTEEDFNYILLEDTQVETSRFEVDGVRSNATGFQAFIYGDRDIYRPGETVHFNTVLRTEKWESASEIPLKIRILQPNGKELKSFLKNTSSQGSVEINQPIDRAAVTGTYQIEVLNGNDVLIASKSISIEEFMPDRIKVDVKAKDTYRSGETIAVNATAVNLFGPPASNRNYEMDFSLKRKVFVAKGYERYSFDIQNDTKFNNDLRQGSTDDNGLAKQDFQIPATYADMGVLEGKVYVTVFDETGRPVNRMKRFDVFTQDTFYGIGLSDYYVGTHVPMNIDLVALSTDGKPKNAKAEVEIYRIDYQTVVEKTGDNLRYSSKRLERLVQTKSVAFSGGKSNIKFIPQLSGEYEIRIRRPEGASYASTGFYAYGYGYTSNSSFEVSNEGEVLMEFDKEKYEVGDEAKILLKAPFAGKILVTVERNKVLQHFYVETDKKSAEIELDITDDMLPNAYVTATLIRKMDGTDMPLTVAHGFAPVKVEKASNLIPVEIVAVEKSRSKTKQKVKIKAKSNAEVTIAVVDEGILQLKNFKTPDIYNHFYQKRALEVSSHDLYHLLFPELSLSSSSSVGGDGYDLEKRINPLSNGRNKLVAIWSGTIDTGVDGDAEFEFDIPQFSGDLRIMAVAYKDNAFGSASKNMKVADPIVISTGVPRFMSPMDEVVVPVTITNTTKNSTTVTASVGLTGGISLLSNNNQQLTVPAEKEIRTYFTVKAPSVIGTGSMKVTVNGMREKFTEEIDLTIRPSTSLLKMAVSGEVLAGQSASVSFMNDYMAGTASGNLLVSKSPMVQFAKELDYLLGYPHGCVEQTVAKAFPQLYFADFAKSLSSIKTRKSGGKDLDPNFNVQEALRKLESMQTYNGGMSYWQGGTTDSWWGTAFATHFMMEARKADFEINENTISKALDYLTNKTASNDLTEDEYFWQESGSWGTRKVAKREMIYSLYALSLAERPNRAVMNYYKANASLLSLDARYMLASSFKLANDESSFKAMLPNSYVIENTQKQTGGSFASPIRNLAISLNSLIESEPDNIQIPKMARQLSQAVKTSPYLSTQEAVFAFLSLGKIAKKANQSNVTGSIIADNKILASFTGQDVNLTNNVINKNVNISAKGRGALYYFAQHEGLSATGKYIEEDQQLRVRRTFLTRTGQPISGGFKQNQLVVVKISLASTDGLPIENVVVTDMLPAGFEIENPRLNEARDMPWITNISTPEHFDIRDDRINFYTTANAQEKTFYYLVRVITKGKFTLGPVSADAMYNGEMRSYSGGGSVVVE